MNVGEPIISFLVTRGNLYGSRDGHSEDTNMWWQHGGTEVGKSSKQFFSTLKIEWHEDMTVPRLRRRVLL